MAEEENNYINFENSDDFEVSSEDLSNYNRNDDTIVEDYKTCPNCNNKCCKEAVFCNKCGSKIEIEYKCPNCGADFAENDMFCIKCGTKLQDKPIEKNIVNQEIFCPICGIKCNESDTFCGECGTKLKTKETFAIKHYTNRASQKSQEATNISEQVTSKYIHDSNTSNLSHDTIKCPYCNSKIPRYTKKCPHCGEWLSGGVSHFGCGSFLVLLTTIIAVCMAIGGESIGVPLVGEIGGIWLVIVAFLYFLPSLISDWRGHDSKFAIFLVNLLFGWTFIGWFIALIFSFTGRSR